MKISILGCGALGQVWLHALSQQGHDVQGWLRVPRSDLHTTLIDTTGKTFHHQFKANDYRHLQQSELLIVTLKAWQVSAALLPLLPQLSPECSILLLHNGMGTKEELPFKGLKLLHGVTTLAAKREGQLVYHVAHGSTHIGPLTSSASTASYLADILHQALPYVAWHNDITAACWNKLAINCAINPLTAIYQCTNGELRQYPSQLMHICREVANVMILEGFHTSAETLFQQVIDVIEHTAANTSSMLQDVIAERHTEIDYITGYLLRRARNHGILIPENARLFATIKQKENNYERIGADLSGSW